MHFNVADQYRRGSSLIHGLDPRPKLIGTLLFIMTATLLPPGAWLALSILFLATLLIAWVSGLGVGYALKRSFVAIPFALAAITLPFTVPGQPILQFGGLVVSAEGTIRFISILIKSWISLQMAVLLTATTPVQDILWGLRALHVPRPFVSIIGFMYRYLFVLGDEALRLMRARASRSGTGGQTGKSGGSIAWRARVTGGMVGNLALRAFERSERIYDAMVARGFQGELRTLTPPTLVRRDWIALAGWWVFLATLLVVGFAT
jgi:cobalt/nickel transport system permease protein